MKNGEIMFQAEGISKHKGSKSWTTGAAEGHRTGRNMNGEVGPRWWDQEKGRTMKNVGTEGGRTSRIMKEQKQVG